MLKWAVHNPRPSYLPEHYEDFSTASTAKLQQQECNYLIQRNHVNSKRKSWTFRCSHPGLDKENLLQLTSTPLSRASSTGTMGRFPTHSMHSLKRVHSLKDLSNILPERTLQNANTSTNMQGTPVRQLPSHYASTLPTFDAEYSPCGLIPGPLLALRGMGIPDSYFEKPRYLDADKGTQAVPPPPPLASTPATLSLSSANVLEEKALLKTSVKVIENNCQEPTRARATATTTTTTTTTNVANDALNVTEQSTLSSSKMGDVTLEHMIDAILASNRKENNRQRHKQRRCAYAPALVARRHHHRSFSMQRRYQEVISVVASPSSPTYRPAYDPASDLTEFAPMPSYGYQEREVCASSLYNQGRMKHQLFRQYGMRRKRQKKQATSTSAATSTKVLQSNRKSLSATISRAPMVVPVRHSSPDSGHNSTSDFEEEEPNIAGDEGKVGEDGGEKEKVQSTTCADHTSSSRALGGESTELWMKEPVSDIDCFRHTFLDVTKRRLSYSLISQKPNS